MVEGRYLAKSKNGLISGNGLTNSPGLPNGIKGLQPRAPNTEGPPKPRQKNSAQFLSVHAELTWDSLERM